MGRWHRFDSCYHHVNCREPLFSLPNLQPSQETHQNPTYGLRDLAVGTEVNMLFKRLTAATVGSGIPGRACLFRPVLESIGVDPKFDKLTLKRSLGNGFSPNPTNSLTAELYLFFVG